MEQKELDKISYALGLSMGNNFKNSGIQTLNVKDFTDGVAAVFEGAEPKMSYTEAKAEIQKYFEAMAARQEEENKAKVKINEEAGAAYLAKNKEQRRRACHIFGASV